MAIGTKNTKEVIKLAIETVKPIVQAIKKDGFQPADLIAFLKSEGFHEALKPALDDVYMIVPELTTLNFFEIMSLLKFVFSELKEIK